MSKFNCVHCGKVNIICVSLLQALPEDSEWRLFSNEILEQIAKSIATRWDHVCSYLNIDSREVIKNNAHCLTVREQSRAFVHMVRERNISHSSMVDALTRAGYKSVANQYFAHVK